MTVVITIVIIPVKIVVIIVMIIVIKIVVAHQHDPKYRCIHRNLPLAFFGSIYTKITSYFVGIFFCEGLWRESCRKSGMIQKNVSSWKPFVELVTIQCWYTHYYKIELLVWCFTNQYCNIGELSFSIADTGEMCLTIGNFHGPHLSESMGVISVTKWVITILYLI